MEKESYSIDDILSEVKKRREQQDVEFNIEVKNDKVESADETTEDVTDNATENKDNGTAAVEENGSVSDNQESEDNLVITQPEEKEEYSENREAAEIQTVSDDENEVAENIEKAAPQEETPEKTPQEETVEQEEPDEVPEGFVDILKMADEDDEKLESEAESEEEKEMKTPFFKTKKGKIFKAVIIILLVLILAGGVFAGVYVYKAAQSISNNNNSGKKPESIGTWTGMDGNAENFPEIIETDASNLTSLQDMIKTWYYNGAPCSSSHIYNVLLIGEDTRGSDILDEGTRADSSIIVSINIDTKTITLASVMRDAYAYWEQTPGDKESGEFSKVTEALVDGIDAYINCIEKLYKIDIDNYVIVNFDSFKAIIDQLGGVELELSSREIREINNNPKVYGNVYIEQTFEGTSGMIKLNGEQALAYCRIRHIDSDAVRVDRQKNTLVEVFNKTKNGSKATQLKVIKALLPYVKTGFDTDEILSIAKFAISHGWLGYDIEMITVPYAKAGGSFYGFWCWKADYPQDANYLQTMLYGKSSVKLAQQRIDFKNCNLYGFYDETLVPTYSVVTNYNYGETTTYPKEEKTTY